MEMKEFVRLAIVEDINDGDHSTLACIPEDAVGKAKLLVKAEGILAGVEEAKAILLEFDSNAIFTQFLKDGDVVIFQGAGDITDLCMRYIKKVKEKSLGFQRFKKKEKKELTN